MRALTFGLVPDEHRQRAADDLAALVREAGTHLGTGFLSTPDLLPALADHGHLDLAYELLLQDTEPSWLTMIDRGATTVWERWDGIAPTVRPTSRSTTTPRARSSRSCTATSPVSSASSRPGPGSGSRPAPGGGVTRAQTEHVSPHGRIAVAWSTEGPVFTVDVVVPPGTVAEVVLPDGTEVEVGAGRHRLQSLP